MKYQTRVRKFAKEARARLLKNEYEKQEQKEPSNRVFKIAKDPQEDRLYEIVCEIALSNEIITDPLKRLMDCEDFHTMGHTEQTKYICNLSNKYISMLERYRNEHIQPSLMYASVLD